MVPLVVLVVVGGSSRLLGAAGVEALDSWSAATRVGLAVMLMLTASAHFGSRRRDLVEMVPRALPRPELLVTVTGLMEIAIAAALLVPGAARWAAAALVPLLVAMFPANVRASRDGIALGGRPPTPLATRAVIQVLFAAAAVLAAA